MGAIAAESNTAGAPVLLSKAEWAELIGAFVEGRIAPEAFETAFFDATRSATNAGESVPYAVDLLFYEVDAYSSDPALRGEGDHDDESLRAIARQLLERIDEPWPPVPGARTADQQMEDFRRAAERLGLVRK